MWGVGLNAVLGYVVVITLCFTITDPQALLDSPTGSPFIQLFYNVTKSYTGTNIMTAIIIINLVSAVISEIATASRQIWSFARDDGFPFSDFLKQVSHPMPRETIWLSGHNFSVARNIPLPSPEKITNQALGEPRLEHPPQRRRRLLRLRRRHRPHQPRLQRRPERHRLPNHVLLTQLIHALHRLYLPKTAPRRGAPPRGLLARPLGPNHQYHRVRLPLRLLRLLLLPHRHTGGRDDDELEHRHVRRDHAVRDGVVRRGRPQEV